MLKIAIVAVGYNRPDSMQNLLNSLVNAEYKNDKVDLVVSIDKGERQAEIVSVANSIQWKYGEKILHIFSERQGLRKHILQCGDLTKIYDAVIVFEDDIIAAKYFYSYVKQALTKYGGNNRIAGISLYCHQMHPGVCRPFEPANNGFDAYLHQFAMSWGQCWTRGMWNEFRKWYEFNEEKDLSDGSILPDYIVRWNKQSWLKYYMRYTVEMDKFFVYPYFALSTNASDAGEHCRIANNDFQIALQDGDRVYNFPEIEDSVRYDVFFERMGVENQIFPELKGRIALDLYGNRSNWEDYDYLISTRKLPYRIICEMGLRYRPIEQNCITPTEGKGIFLYDLNITSARPRGYSNILTRYDIRSIHWKRLLRLGWSGLIDAIMSRLLKGY